VRRGTHNAATHATEECDRFRANKRQVNLYALVLRVGNLTNHRLEQIRIEAAAETAICRDHDVTDALHFALCQERMLVVGIGVCKVTNNTTDALRVGARRFHLFLGLANLARRDLFHRARDLLHVLYRSDL